MIETDARTFWSKQTSSLHRSSDPQFYRRKAEEHASLLSPDERSAGCIDLGCGAGELLVHLCDYVKVDLGLDLSQSMLDEAEKVLASKHITLVNADIFEYLPTSAHAVWMTTGAINQYLDADRVQDFLDLFAANEAARSLFLFDCVDPLRHSLIGFGSSYLIREYPPAAWPKKVLRPVNRFARRALIAAKLALGLFGKPSRQLPGDGMGYGYLPIFWLQNAAERKLVIEIVSSRFYEYRYHVILRKPCS